MKKSSTVLTIIEMAFVAMVPDADSYTKKAGFEHAPNSSKLALVLNSNPNVTSGTGQIRIQWNRGNFLKNHKITSKTDFSKIFFFFSSLHFRRGMCHRGPACPYPHINVYD